MEFLALVLGVSVVLLGSPLPTWGLLVLLGNWNESLLRRRCLMQRKHVLCGLIVAVLIGGSSSQVMAQVFPWWAFDSVIEEVQDRGTLRVGLGLFEPWSACNAAGELIGFEIDVATKVAEDMGVEVEFVRTNWSYIIPSLIAKEFDVIISGMTILPERNLKVNFTSPYNAAGVYLVAIQRKQPTWKRWQISTVPVSRLRPAGDPRQSPLSRMFSLMPGSCSLIPTTRSSRPLSPVRPMLRQRSRRSGPHGSKPTRRPCT